MKFYLAESKFVIYHDFVLEIIYDEHVRQNDNILLQFDETLPEEWRTDELTRQINFLT